MLRMWRDRGTDWSAHRHGARSIDVIGVRLLKSFLSGDWCEPGEEIFDRTCYYCTRSQISWGQ